mmetsp:Transcript_21755/g.76378  ORF Transcript_21755/g.76378 Transcript_21755/m.76378 type:complete len:220 (+) Transcript_21755:2372-3031(+)
MPTDDAAPSSAITGDHSRSAGPACSDMPPTMSAAPQPAATTPGTMRRMTASTTAPPSAPSSAATPSPSESSAYTKAHTKAMVPFVPHASSRYASSACAGSASVIGCMCAARASATAAERDGLLAWRLMRPRAGGSSPTATPPGGAAVPRIGETRLTPRRTSTSRGSVVEGACRRGGSNAASGLEQLLLDPSRARAGARGRTPRAPPTRARAHTSRSARY